MHKTGSTSLQKLVKSNAKVLKRHGVLAPAFNGLIQAFHRSVSMELSKHKRFNPADGTFGDLAKAIAGWGGNIFLSCEMFSVHIADKEHVERLVTFFENNGYRMHVIGYVRNQPEYFNSRYSQEAKRLLRRGDFSVYLGKQVGAPLHNPQHLFGPVLADPRVDVTIKHFDTSIAEGLEWSLLDVVLGAGYDRGQFDIGKRKNETPHPMVVYLSRLVAREIIGSDMIQDGDRPLYWRHIRRISEAEGWVDVKFCGLTDEIAANIREVYREGNEAFAQKVWGKSWPASAPRQYVSNEFDSAKASPEELAKLERYAKEVIELGQQDRAARGAEPVNPR